MVKHKRDSRQISLDDFCHRDLVPGSVALFERYPEIAEVFFGGLRITCVREDEPSPFLEIAFLRKPK